MGGSSKQSSTTTEKSETNPWERTIPQLQGLLDFTGGQISNLGPTNTELSSLNQLTANANAGNPYAAPIASLATDLLGGGIDRTGIAQSGYDQLKGQLSPYATMDTNPYSNEAFQKFTSTLTDDINNRVKSQYAGAGYSPAGTGDYAQTLGRGVAQGIAPTFLQAYGQLEGMKGGAIRDLYNAGNTTTGVLSGLDQTALGNRQAGIGVSTSAQQAKDSPYERLLQIEGMKRNLPLQNAATLESLILPIAQLGGTSNRESTTTSEKSTPMGQQIAGGALGGLGALGQMGAFGPTGWLLGGGGGLLGGAGAAGAGAGLFGSAAGGASAMLPLLALSDRRLKSDIERIGIRNGLPIYEYTIFGKRQRGVMADEVERVMPDAVVVGPHGFKMVDYGAIGIDQGAL